MKLKKVYEAEADIPADVLSFYEERDGKWHLTLEIEGSANQDDVTRLNGALTKERNDHRLAKEKLRKFEGLGDVDEVQAKLDRLDDLSDGDKLPDEEKVNREVERRLRAKTAPLERQIKQAQDALVEAERERDETKGTLRGRTISDEVRVAASRAKIIDSAVDDVLMYGNSIFEVGEDGNVVTRDGLNGVTPGLKPEAWLSDMKEKRPHWWPTSQGAGSTGGKGGTSLDNPFTAEAWNVTEQGRIAATDMAKAERLAKLAGTTLGGSKPQPKQRAA